MDICIHAFTPYSSVNGPGERSVLHFQGCRFSCPGCFNPETHAMDQGRVESIDSVLNWIPVDVEGVTISGGEPFLQREALLQLVSSIKEKGYTVVVFSGYYLHEIQKLEYGLDILSYVDVLIDGRFDQELKSQSSLHGSDNQNIHLFTNRYNRSDFNNREVEFTIDLNGEIQITGFPTSSTLSKVK